MNPQWLILLCADGPIDWAPWPLFTLEPQTFLNMVPNILSFAILAFVFARFLYKPIKEILQKRADRIEADIKEAEGNKAAAEELKLMYEQKVKDIELERVAILDEARKEATARLNQIIGDAKDEAQITRDRASRDIATELERVKAEVHQAIIDISTDMAAKLVAANIDKRNHDDLFADALRELEATAFRSY